MSSVSKVDKSQSEISQEIDLAEIFGRSPTTLERDRFLQEAVERIIERTQSGKDVKGKDFKSYTKDYAELKGVSRGDVDLTLFGDMLLAIDGESDGDRVRLRIDGEEAAKAYGHVTGFKGHPTIPSGKYKRDFFGLTNEEAETIAESVRDERADVAREQLSAASPSLNITEILRNIGLEIGDS